MSKRIVIIDAVIYSQHRYMKQLAYLIGLLALTIPASCQSVYEVSDHTAENIFTSGIEGSSSTKTYLSDRDVK